MCGILGFITQNQSDDLLRNVRLEALRNRGPDNIGRYIDDNVGFYHTRLAVIDRHEASNQPILSPCGNYAVICNGEIYNYLELKKRYQYAYQTTSDCEVILSAYQHEGICGFKNFKGMFSFGLYDQKNKKVVIYRDAVGKKPLFYYHDHKTFCFASSVTAIRDNISSQLTIDQAAIHSYLALGYVKPDLSLYQEIRPLLPGYLIEIDITTGNMATQYSLPTSTSYHGFDYHHAEIMAQADRLLNQSIERRIAGIEQPVLLFSGGIDSTILAQKMFDAVGKKLTCVSLRPLIPRTYDEPYARYAAKKFGVNYIAVGFQWQHLQDEINLAISLLDQPLSLYSYYLLTCLTRKAREFGNTLFMGDGGDEVFYGYADINSWFSREPNFQESDELRVGPALPSDISVWGKRQATFDLIGHSFVKVDKATAEQQIEARCPFLDWDLMQFVRTIPSQYFLQAGTTKPILKNLLVEFPHWFLERKKIGFGFNFRYLLVPLYKTMYQEIEFDNLTDLGVLTPKISFSYQALFKNFDYFWKLYVLSKFCKYNNILS